MPKIQNNDGEKPSWFKVKNRCLLHQHALEIQTKAVIHRHGSVKKKQRDEAVIHHFLLVSF